MNHKDKAAFFGRSKTLRFNSKIERLPGPCSYSLPSTIQLKTEPKTKLAMKPAQHSHALAQQPVLDYNDTVPVADVKKPVESEIQMILELEELPPPPAEMSVSLEFKYDKHLGPEAKGLVKKPKASRSAPAGNKITWKRKHIPPSIPSNRSAFGYKETTGKLFIF
jgi:hypothetical protein